MWNWLIGIEMFVVGEDVEVRQGANSEICGRCRSWMGGRKSLGKSAQRSRFVWEGANVDQLAP
jgi:hypothetical protein